jgi:serine/threonine protein kinase
MGKMQLRKEALQLQGTDIQCDNRTLHISGGSSQAEFESGSEGLVHLATDKDTGEKFRIKCFWEPHDLRRRRSENLVGLELCDLNKSKADSLGGAPFRLLPAFGPCTPFAVVMKNVRGENWKKLRERAKMESQYPPGWWPSAEIRATWGYGLATAVMKMEDRGFIHADLSPGNVVVNDGFHGILGGPAAADGPADGEDEAGDMALVDFDRYVHLPDDLPELGQGSEGYAAPEIWEKQVPSVGSDRTALAILIQEFLVVGDSDLSREESLDWSYDQDTRSFVWSFGAESESSDDHGDVHPLLERKYPALAELVRGALTPRPDVRPSPQAWRRPLRDIVAGSAHRDRAQFRGLLIEADPSPSSTLRTAFSPAKDYLDLSTTGFGIRASLERDASGLMFLVVHNGAKLSVRSPMTEKWTQYSGGERLVAEIGMVLFDQNGKSKARLDRPK